ncbi:4-galactosyl-N-acetylglucosaminide 3-alpha-L-fucosyltransferase FUT6-like [Rhinophrynus dorsalis]
MLFAFILQTTFSFILFVSFRGQKKTEQEIITSDEESWTLVILLWTWPLNYHFPLNKCPQPYNSSDCFFTVDRSMYSVADAVIFHHRDVCRSRYQLPQTPRPTNQYWIWFNLESPSHSPNLAFMDNLINLTMSYRIDSDIFTPYGWIENNNEIKNFTIPKKTKLVAWLVSNWNPQSRRVKYYGELKKYLKVDIYGRQHQSLPRNKNLETLSKYKFYLAFENSIHQDYITEKLWRNALVSGTVPVVLGPPRENYERFIPPDSFIHVDDFSTAEELASYLLKLDNDIPRYNQYFNWRSKFQATKSKQPWITDYCKVCKALKEAPPYRTIPSIAKWFK